MTILVLAPHPDDEGLGVGGTIAKYAAEGERVVVVIFSGGESSHPLHKEHVITKRRKDEALAAHAKLGVKESVFLMLADLNLKQELVEKEVFTKIHDIIKKEKPKKIFMPAIDDLHKDHRAVSHMMLQLYSQYELTCRIYTYSIWNPLAFIKRNEPRLVVDITDYQQKKLAAIREYKSQRIVMWQIVPLILIKSFFSGLRYGHRWVEVFIQVK